MVFLAYRQKASRVSEARSNSLRPLLKLGAGPLKAVVLVAKLSRGESGKLHVVFRVRGGDNHGPWPGCFKDDPFESRQSGFIEQIRSIFHLRDQCLMFFSR